MAGMFISLMLSGCGKYEAPPATQADPPPDLFTLIEAGDANGVANALAKGADVRAVRFGWTPLHHVFSHRGDISEEARVRMVEALLAHKADPNAMGGKSTTGLVPLHFAAVYGETRGAELLLKAGAKVDAAGDDGKRPIISHAATFGRSEMLRLLLKHGADPNVVINSATSTRGMAPLHLVARGIPQSRKSGEEWVTDYKVPDGQGQMIRDLLAAGADPSLKDAEGRTALDLAKALGHPEAVAALEEAQTK